MSSSTRLKLSIVMIVLSMLFAVLIAQSPQIASAVATGYVAVLLTVILLTNVWKKP